MLKHILLKKVLTVGILTLALTASNNIFTGTQALAYAEPKAVSLEEIAAIDANCAKWKYASGSYSWDKSSEYSRKTLQMLNLTDRALIYELNLYQGNEDESTPKHQVYRGIINLDEDGVGHSYLGDKEIHFDLEKNHNYVLLTHDATIPFEISPDGLMESNSAPYYTLEFFTMLLECFQSSATGLYEALENYDFKEVGYQEGNAYNSGFYIVEAHRKNSGKMVAKYAVASDMSEIYRNGKLIHRVIIPKG